MPYATVQDMVDRWGQTEMIRLTTPDGTEMTTLDAAAIERAIAEASAVVDSYLRRRYAAPLAAAPYEIRRAVCVIARYDLSHGENREPGEQVRLQKKEVLDWLGEIAAGRVLLDLEEVQSGEDSYAQVSTRVPAYGSGPRC
jgi:phage gp36-like protein